MLDLANESKAPQLRENLSIGDKSEFSKSCWGPILTIYILKEPIWACYLNVWVVQKLCCPNYENIYFWKSQSEASTCSHLLPWLLNCPLFTSSGTTSATLTTLFLGFNVTICISLVEIYLKVSSGSFISNFVFWANRIFRYLEVGGSFSGRGEPGRDRALLPRGGPSSRPDSPHHCAESIITVTDITVSGIITSTAIKNYTVTSWVVPVFFDAFIPQCTVNHSGLNWLMVVQDTSTEHIS